MKRWHVGEEGLNRLVGTFALVALASLWLCVAVGLLSAFLSAFVSFDVEVFLLQVIVYVGFPLAVALGWYMVYRLWKQYFYRKPVAKAPQIIKLLGSLLFVALVALGTYLLFVMVSYAVTH